MKPLSTAHQAFADRVATGTPAPEAYQAAYPDCRKSAASAAASRLLKDVNIQAEIVRIRREAQKMAGGSVLTTAIVHDFLFRLVTSKITEVPPASDLWQSIEDCEFGHKFKLPCKLGAIGKWMDLAGEGAEAGANEALSGLLGRIRK